MDIYPNTGNQKVRVKRTAPRPDGREKQPDGRDLFRNVLRWNSLVITSPSCDFHSDTKIKQEDSSTDFEKAKIIRRKNDFFFEMVRFSQH